MNLNKQIKEQIEFIDNCAIETVPMMILSEELEKLVEMAYKQGKSDALIEKDWEDNPDRMGGQFTDDEYTVREMGQ